MANSWEMFQDDKQDCLKLPSLPQTFLSQTNPGRNCWLRYTRSSAKGVIDREFMSRAEVKALADYKLKDGSRSTPPVLL